MSISLSAQNFTKAYAEGSAATDRAKSVAVDNAGNYVTVGLFNSTAVFGTTSITSFGGGNAFVAKYDATDNLLWVRKAGATSGVTTALDVTIDNTGNIYVVGEFQNTATFTGISTTITLTSTGSYDGYVSKYNSAGELLWVQNVSNSSFSSAVQQISQVEISVNKLIYAGKSNSTHTIAGVGSLPMGPFLGAMDLNGNALWAYNFGTVSLMSSSYLDDDIGLATDDFRYIYVSSSTSSSTVVTGSNTSISLSSPSGSFPLVYAQYDNLGRLYWARISSGTSAVKVSDNSISCSRDGSTVVLGGAYSGGSLSFSGLPALPAVSSTVYNGYLLRINGSTGNSVWNYHQTDLVSSARTAVLVSTCDRIYHAIDGRSTTQVFSNSPVLTLGIGPAVNTLGLVCYDFSGNRLNQGTAKFITPDALAQYKKDVLLAGELKAASTTVNTTSGLVTLTSAGGFDVAVLRYNDPTQPTIASITSQPTVTTYVSSSPAATFASLNAPGWAGNDCSVTWWVYYPALTGIPTYPWVPATWLFGALGFSYQENFFGTGSLVIKNPPPSFFAVATIDCDCGTAISDIVLYDGSSPTPITNPLFRMSNLPAGEGKWNAASWSVSVAPNPSIDGIFSLNITEFDGQETNLSPEPLTLPPASAQPFYESQPVLPPTPVGGEQTYYSVLDLTGRVIVPSTLLNTASARLDLSDMVPGIYLLRVEKGNSISTVRLIR
ncbi:MAG: T9SS type A sorting domain-containing protein [Bacteroidia bacterium]|nr:T9SS type A sorting domain-containing protein [Bacteroidia bacterium]